MEIKMDEIKIKIKSSQKLNLKAIAEVNFGEITAKGFRLSVSEFENENLDREKLFLQPPCYRAGWKWQKIVWLNNETKWKQLERKVFDQYKVEYPEETNKKEDEDIEWDSIGKSTI